MVEPTVTFAGEELYILYLRILVLAVVAYTPTWSYLHCHAISLRDVVIL